jgi:hypothetical protein
MDRLTVTRGSAIRLLITSCLLLAARAADADPNPDDSRLQLSLEGRFGSSTGPYVTPAFPQTTAYGGVIGAHARLRVNQRLWLGLRAPLVLARVKQPAGALFAEAAWANPELSADFEALRLERQGWRLALHAGLALGLPLAEHDRAQLAGRTLAFADSLEGFGEPELFTPGVLPLTPRASLQLSSGRWRFGASLKLPVLARVSEASLPSDATTRALGLVGVAALEARLQLLRWLALGAAPRLAVRAIAPVDDHASAAQLSVLGRVEIRLADELSASALFQAPVAGPLGGSTLGGGLLLSAAF